MQDYNILDLLSVVSIERGNENQEYILIVVLIRTLCSYSRRQLATKRFLKLLGNRIGCFKLRARRSSRSNR